MAGGTAADVIGTARSFEAEDDGDSAPDENCVAATHSTFPRLLHRRRGSLFDPYYMFVLFNLLVFRITFVARPR